jgi:GWxTD domain-containing protein
MVKLLNGYRVVLLALAFLGGCSFQPDQRQGVEEGDFIEPVSTEDAREAWARIADLKDQVERDFKNAELHRQLAVLYRLAGTPHARLLSSEEIDKAISLDPANPMLYVEQGLTLVARRFTGEAEASFNRAVEIDPRCFEAWYQLARMEQCEYLKTMCFPEQVIKAIDYYEKAFRIDRKDEDTLVNLAFLHSFRRLYQTGLKYGTRAVMYHPKSARAHLVCGMLLTRAKDFAKAEKEFSTAFLLMSDEERRPYEDISPLLAEDERDLYLSSSPEKRRDWERRFWIENDPTPATDVNERRLEHYSRVLIADWALSDERRDSKGAETDRGAALIRFGLPDKKLYDLGGGTSGGWIVWQYTTPRGSFNLYFNDEFLNGDYHFPISDSYGETSLRTLNTVPQRYEYPIYYAPFPISVEIAERRGGEERTRLEFSIAVPDSLGRLAYAPWNIFVTFFDADMNRFSRDRLSVSPDTMRTIEKQNGKFLVSSFALEMLPRELTSTCVVEVVQDKALRKGTRRCPIDIRDLYGRSLKISSIALTLPGPDGSCSNVLDPIPSYRVGGKLCLRYEVYNLALDERNEARYRLTYAIRTPGPEDEPLKGGLQRTLSYMWSSMHGKKPGEKPYIESSIEQRAQTSTVSDNLQIDIGSLEKGVYVLSLEAEDLVTGMAAAESRVFTVTD